MATIKKRALKTCILKIQGEKNFSTQIVGQYFSKVSKKTVSLTNDFKIIEGEVPDGTVLWKHPFMSKEQSVTFQYDMNDDTYPQSVLRLFLLSHSSVICEGYHNPNLSNPLFELIDDQSLNEDLYERIISVAKMVNMISNMTWEQQKQVCYTFGGNPQFMSKRELFLDLLDPISGRLMFMDVKAKVNKCQQFLNKYGNDESRIATEIEMYCRKAIMLDIIGVGTQEGGGSIYTVGGKTVATTEEGLFAYMATNKEIFEQSIQAAVDLRTDEIEPEDLDTPPQPGDPNNNFIKKSDKGESEEKKTGEPLKVDPKEKAYLQALKDYNKMQDSKTPEALKNKKLEEMKAGLDIRMNELIEMGYEFNVDYTISKNPSDK